VWLRGCRLAFGIAFALIVWGAPEYSKAAVLFGVVEEMDHLHNFIGSSVTDSASKEDFCRHFWGKVDLWMTNWRKAQNTKIDRFSTGPHWKRLVNVDPLITGYCAIWPVFSEILSTQVRSYLIDKECEFVFLRKSFYGLGPWSERKCFVHFWTWTYKQTGMYEIHKSWSVAIISDCEMGLQSVGTISPYPFIVSGTFYNQPRPSQRRHGGISRNSSCVSGYFAGVCGSPSSLIGRFEVAELPKEKAALQSSNNDQGQRENRYRRPRSGVPDSFWWLLIIAGPVGFFVAIGLAGLVYSQPGQSEDDPDER